MGIAKLSIDLEAQLARLQEGLDKAGRMNESLASRIEARWAGLRAGAASIGTALVAAFSVATLSTMVRNTLDGVDALNDLRDATGASIEMLSALNAVAMRNGESLETVSSILVRFNAVLKDASPDTAAARALKAIGVNVAELRRLDPAEALRQVSVALARFEDDGNKARIVQELFGKSIREAAPFLNDLAEQTELVGTVTTRQAKETEALNKLLAELKTRASEAGRSLLLDLVPGLSAILKQITESRSASELFSRLWGNIVGNLGQMQLKGQAADLKLLNTEINSVTFALDNMLEASRRNPQNSQYAARVEFLRGELARLQAQALAAGDALKAAADAKTPRADPGLMGTGFGAIGTSGQARPALPPLPDENKTRKAARAFEDYQASVTQSLARLIEESDVVRVAKLNDQLRRLEELAKAGLDPNIVTEVRRALIGQDVVIGDAQVLAKRVEAQRQLNELIAATPLAQQEQLLRQQQLLDEAFASGAVSAEKYAQATQQIRDQTIALDPRLRELEEQTRNVGRQLEATLGESLQAALQGNFNGIADAWANMLGRMALEAATKNLANALFGGGGAASFLGTLFGGPAGAAASGAPTWLGGPQAANGAVVTGTTPFLAGNRIGVMGEAGPEAVVPLKRGRDGKLGIGGGSGGGVVINNHISAGVQRSEMMSALQLAMSAVESNLMMRLRAAGVA